MYNHLERLYKGSSLVLFFKTVPTSNSLSENLFVTVQTFKVAINI